MPVRFRCTTDIPALAKRIRHEFAAAAPAPDYAIYYGHDPAAAIAHVRSIEDLPGGVSITYFDYADLAFIAPIGYVAEITEVTGGYIVNIVPALRDQAQPRVGDDGGEGDGPAAPG